MKTYKAFSIKDFDLSDDEILAFECSRPNEPPCVGIGNAESNRGSEDIIFSTIEPKKERQIGEHIPDDEHKILLAIRFYTPESLDVLIRVAERAKNLLGKGKEPTNEP